jgi:uncharacterized protein YktA (UPF0223 family)
MRNKLNFIIAVCLIIGTGILSTINAEEKKKALPTERVEVYYLHNTFRCLSCNTIENLTKTAIFGGKGINEKYKNSIDVKPAYKKAIESGKLTFKSVNIDKKENKHLLTDFHTESKYPVLVKIRNGKIVKTKVLDEVWKLMDENEKFIEYIQTNLNEFMKK